LLAEEWDIWHLQREAGHVVGPNAVPIAQVELLNLKYGSVGRRTPGFMA
jgi:hypothetical protein